jgi:hypothetical protein
LNRRRVARGQEREKAEEPDEGVTDSYLEPSLDDVRDASFEFGERSISVVDRRKLPTAMDCLRRSTLHF